MNESSNSSTVKVYRVSDLIGRKKKLQEEPLKKRTLLAKKYRHKHKHDKEPVIVMEASSFKVSNKITVHGAPKTKKVKEVKECDILQLHEERKLYFQKLQKSLPKLEKKLNTANTQLTDREIQNLKKEIQSIREKTDETIYYAETSELIEKYKKVCLLNTGFEHDQGSTGLMKFIDKYDNKEKESLAEEYCKIINNGLMINPKKLEFDNSLCEECQGETCTIEGFVTCTECGVVSSKTTHDFQVSYKDLCDTTIKTNFSYKRVNRFKEILATLQAKENTDIPNYVIDAIKTEIKKENNIDYSSIDQKKIKYYLKRLSLTTYYEHAPNILNIVIGKRALSINHKVEEKLLEMFAMIQEPFEAARTKIAPSRQSFLSYGYVIFKLCELLDLNDMKSNFSLLKSSDKLKLHDKIWFEIVKSLDWLYISTL